MSDATETRTEISKLARLLRVDAADLDFLTPIGWQQLREFRNGVSDSFFAQAEDRLTNLAAATKFVPNPVIIKLAPKYFEPRMAAGMASLIDEDKALKLVPKLPIQLLAETVKYIDPRRVGAMAARMPTDVAGKLLPGLLADGEFPVLGQLIDYVTDEQRDEMLPLIDDASLLRVLEVVENKPGLNALLGALGEARLGRLVAVARESSLMSVVIDLLEYTDRQTRARLLDAIAQQTDSVIESLLSALSASGAVPLLTDALDAASTATQQRIARTPGLADAGLLREIVAAANGNVILGLAATVTGRTRELLGDAVADGGANTASALLNAALAASDAGPTGTLLRLTSEIASNSRGDIVAMIAALPGAQFDALVQWARRSDTLSVLIGLAPGLPADLREKLTGATAELDRDDLEQVVVDASNDGNLGDFLAMATQMPQATRAKVVEIIAENEDDDLLATTADEQTQQNVWNQLMQLASGSPDAVVSRLAEQVSQRGLDEVLPMIMNAGQATSNWGGSFALIDNVQRIAAAQGVDVQLELPAQLAQSALAAVAASAQSLPNLAAGGASIPGLSELAERLPALASAAGGIPGLSAIADQVPGLVDLANKTLSSGAATAPVTMSLSALSEAARSAGLGAASPSGASGLLGQAASAATSVATIASNLFGFGKKK